MSRLLPLALLLTAGCWKTELSEISSVRVDFAPEAGGPEGWIVEQFALPLDCPDGGQSAFLLVYPETADLRDNPSAEPVPLAVFFHSGALDFVDLPVAEDPLAGDTLRDESHLTRQWAIRRLYTMLGMYPASAADSDEFHTGTLPAALADAGIAMLLPANCWGDTWHNRSALAENDFSSDLFFRNGRAAAEFAVGYAEGFTPTGAAADLPILVDQDALYAVGLGEGGRAIGELLSLRNSAGPRHQFASVVLDSTVDDLRAYYGKELFADTVRALDRIFPEGEESTKLGAFGWIGFDAFPAHVGYIYSTGDSLIPVNAHVKTVDYRMKQMPDPWLYEDNRVRHVLSNSDPELAAQIASFLVEGTAGLDPAWITPIGE